MIFVVLFAVFPVMISASVVVCECVGGAGFKLRYQFKSGPHLANMLVLLFSKS